MTLLQWRWFKRWSSTSRINDALYKCDALCSFLLFFKCCHFNHGNGLKILLTSAENLLYLDHVLWLESLSLPMSTMLIMSSKWYLFVSFLSSYSLWAFLSLLILKIFFFPFNIQFLSLMPFRQYAFPCCLWIWIMTFFSLYLIMP